MTDGYKSVGLDASPGSPRDLNSGESSSWCWQKLERIEANGGRGFNTLLRLTWGFVIGILGAMLFSSSISILFQAVFLVVSAENDEETKTAPLGGKAFVASAIPPVAFFLAFLLSQQLELVSDAMDKPAFPRFRAYLHLTANKFGFKVIRSQQIILLMWLVFIFFPLFWVVGKPVFNAFSQSEAEDVDAEQDMSYIHEAALAHASESMVVMWSVALAGGLTLLVVFTGTKLVTFTDAERSKMWLSLSKDIQAAESSEDAHQRACDRIRSLQPGSVEQETKSRKWSFFLVASFVLLLLCGTVLAFIPVQLFQAGRVALWLSFLTALVGISVSGWKALPRDFAPVYPVLFAIQLMFMVCLIVGHVADTSTMNTKHDWESPLFTGLDRLPDGVKSLSYKGEPEPYGICSMSWGHPDIKDPAKRLQAVDMSIFAMVPYFSTKALMMSHITAAFSSTSIGKGIKIIDAEKVMDQSGRPLLIEVPDAKTCVLSFRGTLTFQDVVADGDMWSTVKALGLSSSFLPVLNILPKALVEAFVSSCDVKAWFGYSQVWDHSISFAQRSVERCDKKGFQVVVAGHSMGGGLAQIVGSRLGLPAFCMSPVGFGYSLKHFNISRDSSFRHLTNVLPANDIVPPIDKQLGMSQNIRCKSRSGVLCHLFLRTACELLASCGNLLPGREPLVKGALDKCHSLGTI